MKFLVKQTIQSNKSFERAKNCTKWDYITIGGVSGDKAIDVFNKLNSFRADKAGVAMLRRVEEYKKNPPPEDWNTVHVLDSK